MIDRILAASLKNRLLVVLLALGVIGGGLFSLTKLPIDAFPDVSPTLVQVVTEAPGLAPEEVEKLITYPVEVAMNGMPGVVQVKSLSAFGISQVSVYFQDDVNIYFARQLTLEKLQDAREQIPPGLGEPRLGAITTGLGQVYQYVLRADSAAARDAMELRTLQDWIVKYNLRTVPGVTDVLSFGGEVKQYQVRVDPRSLLQYRVTLAQVREAIGANNRNVGGGYIERGPEEYLIRGLGLAESVGDLANVIVADRGGTPVYVRNVAEVALGPEVRRGAVTMNGEGEAVSGIVLKRIYENTSQVIKGVKARVVDVNKSLPPGVKVVPYYDQSELVERAVGTVKDALLEGAVLIVVVLFLFLGDVRSALIVTTMLPLSLFLAFLLMQYFGLSANLMSLGGLAIGIGMMVDGGVVMVENVYRHLSEAKHAAEHGPAGQTATGPGNDTTAAEESGYHESRRHLILRSAREVGRPIVFAIAIIILVFLPLFTLQGVEGKMFRPMAFAISFAMVGSLIFSLTVIPVLCSFFLKGGSEDDNWVMRQVKKPYLPALRWSIANRRTTLIAAVVALAASLAIVPFLGSEFVPVLEEGSILYRATLAPSAGLNEAIRTATELERMAKSFPEVDAVVSKIGRAEAGGDPEPVNNIEAIVTLRPEKEWKTGRDKAALVEALEEKLGAFPGVALNFSQPIANRVDELLSGVKAQLAIQLFGDDLDQLVAKADEIRRTVLGIRGATDVQAEQVTGQPQLQIRIDRNAIARYGINVEDVQQTIETAIGGEPAGQVFEGIRRFDITVRLQEAFRRDADAIGGLLVPTPQSGIRVPLSQLSEIRTVVGPKQISHDNGQRRIVIQLNVRGRDLGGFVAEAQRQVAEKVKLPPGYFVTWGGQFENQQRAMRRLMIIVPITIVLIYLLLFSSFGSLKQAALIILNVPFALIGGILGLLISRQYLSVPASVGFIALFGVAVLNGVVLVSYINSLRQEGKSVTDAVYEGTVMRLRPVLMTATVAILGLLPLLFSSGAGSEVQRPLAAVVVGGLITSTALTLLLLPTLYGWFEGAKVEY
ncbi:MAG TPA: CusA/CzcA family heavy metal efflux RND transporter [Gemmatimonadaceae bacterium]|nr:CusA/CzcA family heavy metal efflux RND transporter [Gemmatimonadaceae bacterium]